MKSSAAVIIIFLLLSGLIGEGCTGNNSQAKKLPVKEGISEETSMSMEGTWRLLSVLTIEGEDSLLTNYTDGVKGIKMLNETHFAFFQHDLHHGKERDSLYVSGGGTYTYVDGIYTEHLEYCNFRVYENNTFSFEVTITGDRLVQRGEEEVAEAGVSKYIIETYVREK